MFNNFFNYLYKNILSINFFYNIVRNIITVIVIGITLYFLHEIYNIASDYLLLFLLAVIGILTYFYLPISVRIFMLFIPEISKVSSKILEKIRHKHDFNTKSYKILFVIEEILTIVEEKIEYKYIHKLSNLKYDVKNLDVETKISELEQIELQIIDIGNKIVKNVYENINNNEIRIQQAYFPEFFYPQRQSIQNKYSTLINESNLELYIIKFSELMKIMIPIMETSKFKCNIINVYKRIEKKIQHAIERKGIITESDFKLKNFDEFMKLYDYFHPEVSYDNHEKSLSNYLTNSLHSESESILNITKLKNVSFAEIICPEIKNKEFSYKKYYDVIEKEIELKKYIKSSYSFKLKPEYIPCLLYNWSKHNKRVKFIECEKEYLVYDYNTVKKEIKDSINEIESDQSLKFSELKEMHVKVPLPNNEIITIIEELKEESDLYNDIKYNLQRIWRN